MMENLNITIAENLQKLRKASNLTQLELAKKINYSDKAVSKWERGESVPDIEMLIKLAGIYDVSLEFLTKKHVDREFINIKESGFSLKNFLIMILLCISVVFIATVLFIYPTIQDSEASKTYWVTFIFMIPICSIIVALYGHKEKIWLCEFISSSIFVWTAITSIFCLSIVLGRSSFWLLFLVGFPIQAAILILFLFKKKI